ncbi:TetR/AcrR family transcriptional regulator [Novosphingobium resinovorum]|uniref:TetR family transcriptional regulator n=1 Tax=Novosphingobium resinovorum TaxID=158500 RepID=A0A031JQN8_9SPHN|nr:TetR/AcrR family transcriptional regulator [Novosphingobium resinovorum]AOR79658.1 TetR family transcriptional regulator [Novosphingobium resinovorum]EZP79240.1 TetR family transcriptional regulator [Novosphingobium resinovorum]
MTTPEPDFIDSPFRSPEDRLREKDQKREAVLLAAVRAFNARGFQAASLDEVAASLRISKPTIYRYLGNKEQVLLECITRGLELLQEAAAEAEREPGSGLTRLTHFLRRYAEINMDDFGRCVVRTDDNVLSEEGRAHFRALKRRIDQAMRDLVAAGVEDASIAPLDVRMTAFTLAGALNWPGQWYAAQGEQSAEALAATMVDVLVRGLAPRG